MYEFSLGYREVIPDLTVLDSWKEITLNTGGTQGTLQDIKVTEKANGYCYRDYSKHHTRNRFIYWRISHDILELVEHSLDINLAGNRIRYKFTDTPILDGLSIHETHDNVIILVPTVCSIHRLVFPHPNKYHRQDDYLGSHPDLAAPSIFSEATGANTRDPNTFHFFTNPTSQLPILAASSLTLTEEEAIFILAYPSSELLLVKQSCEGKVETIDLKNESMVPRFLSGLASKLRQKDKDGDTIVTLLLHTFGLETFALTLCRNGHLKFWSCTKAECAAVIDIGAETEDTFNQIHIAQNHILRKASDGFDSECLLAIFLSFPGESLLHILKPSVNGSHISLARFNTLRFPQNDLIDFMLDTSHIWLVWRSKDGECAVHTASLQFGNHWTPVVLEEIPDSNKPPNLDRETDPRQIYLEHIFHPGLFPLHIISKALNIYKRSTIVSDINLSAALLRQQICLAVEEEIQNELRETEVNDEDYIECANYCWQRFYSCCVQYHVAGLKPLGLLLLPNSSGAVLLKKSMISFLRPLDIFEHVLYNSGSVTESQINKYMSLDEDSRISEGVLNLFKVIYYLDQQMTEVFAYSFVKELAALRSPDEVMLSLLEKIQNEMDNEFTDHIADMLNSCSDLYQAIHKILELLLVENQMLPEQLESNHVATINHIFTSQLGVSVVAGCLRQQALARFSVCRNLLLISNILLDRQELEWNILEAIRSVCTPEIVVLTQANYIAVWLSGLTALSSLPTETAMQRLAPLKLSPVFNLKNSSSNFISLLDLFAGSTGGYEARRIFAMSHHSEDSLAHWHLSLLPYLNSLYHIIWPISGEPILGEWLLSCGQHLWLQQYVRLLSSWCEWNSCTHSFLLAASLLTTGENYKAQELFEIAAKGIFREQFLVQRFGNFNNDYNETRAYTTYYLKVIHLFELHKSLDGAINLANTALSITPPDDPLAATLYSIKFKHYLALKNYETAYDSLNANPDTERKKDNLRDLVKHLLDEKKLDILLNFSYGSMEELFCNILFTRARASDATNNIYYDFLYSYLIKRGPSFFRLAASVMYEQAFRINQTMDPEVLEKQVKCYLAAKNTLELCQPQFAYIVIPVEQIEDKIITLPPKADSSEKPEELIFRKQVNIIDLKKLKKNLSLASAKLKLLRYNPRRCIEVTNPTELVVLLTNDGLFRLALEICKEHNVLYRIPFETLTKKCINLSRYVESDAWKWLFENDFQDLPPNNRNICDVAWNLLQDCLNQYEEPKLTVLHKVVCNQILKMNAFIPQWLFDSYKKLNPSELFRLLYNNGRLEEATEFASDYMLAALGYGKEYFGLSHSLQPTAPAVCLPIRGFLLLIQQLEYVNENDPSQPLLKEYERFKGIFDTYIETAGRTSNEMCHYLSRT